MTEINHKENLINCLEKIQDLDIITSMDWCVNENRIMIQIIGKNCRFECFKDYDTELCRSAFQFLNQMFVL